MFRLWGLGLLLVLFCSPTLASPPELRVYSKLIFEKLDGSDWAQDRIEIFYNFSCASCYRAHQELLLLPGARNEFKIIPVSLGRDGAAKNTALLAIVIKAHLPSLANPELRVFQATQSPLQWEGHRYNKFQNRSDAELFASDLGVKQEYVASYFSSAEKVLAENNERAARANVRRTPAAVVSGGWITQGLQNKASEQFDYVSTVLTAHQSSLE